MSCNMYMWSLKGEGRKNERAFRAASSRAARSLKNACWKRAAIDVVTLVYCLHSACLDGR